jgi:hypothetical protein
MTRSKLAGRNGLPKSHARNSTCAPKSRRVGGGYTDSRLRNVGRDDAFVRFSRRQRHAIAP